MRDQKGGMRHEGGPKDIMAITISFAAWIRRFFTWSFFFLFAYMYFTYY
jgi:hypothetical protein